MFCKGVPRIVSIGTAVLPNPLKPRCHVVQCISCVLDFLRWTSLLVPAESSSSRRRYIAAHLIRNTDQTADTSRAIVTVLAVAAMTFAFMFLINQRNLLKVHNSVMSQLGTHKNWYKQSISISDTIRKPQPCSSLSNFVVVLYCSYTRGPLAESKSAALAKGR